ncbi:MAG: fla cluster protein FlaF, partial [Candidatus Syntrophoarchaeum sp. WYZ-LMO15]
NDSQDILTIDVKNTGSTVLNASKVDVLLDGELETANITSLKVNGVDSSVWSPEDTLQIKISGVAANPTRIKVIAENGISDYYGS